MIATPETMIHDVTQEFQALIDYVTNDESRHRTAYEVERTLFRRLLALGAALLQLFFASRAATRPSEPRTPPTGRRMRYTGMRATTYVSVFGRVRFARHYYTAPGHPGTCPLDAELFGGGGLCRRCALCGRRCLCGGGLHQARSHAANNDQDEGCNDSGQDQCGCLSHMG